ncbi:HAMP domain-containing sensor histidine kinase [Wenyingzhuangia sp. chi5]|uniref:histidine kinase n=1 Tax=Wenyingzhuangia gilva TaxID=3057677 RepID=A0ABT8VU80_9FLAO|nr:HAMP domain-containing sensor histidine kinase [Wenyingzhuangia sp. chi5]MDO3695535.1 HAMP domain-containing sensor histidine kinase [Wenyingzhuangia sp. chi5]
MKIRNKIVLYFTTTVIALSATSLTIVYFLFAEYREEEFQQQQKKKIEFTVKQIAKYKIMSENLAHIMDELTIHDFYDEKMLIYDGQKKLIFSSIDDLPINKHKTILKKLSVSKDWIETKEENYDLIGLYTEYNHKGFYAISKAYDAFGYSKMYFLKTVLIGIFAFITLVIVLISLYISNKISKPLTVLSEKLSKFDLGNESIMQLEVETSSYELTHLTNRFNELIKRTNETFAFQKHTTHHISHQLKTPIAILVSELERINLYNNIDEIKPEIEAQINRAKFLGNIINVLLEISKVESGQKIKEQSFRADELIFDIMDELIIVYPNFNFEINYEPNNIEEKSLIIKGNKMLVRQAFMNLMVNAVNYAHYSKSEIKLDCTSNEHLKVSFLNHGTPILKEEQKYLFKHFFRGENSRNKAGFGLGLVLTKKIIDLSNGNITYDSPFDNLNVFEVNFPLR